MSMAKLINLLLIERNMEKKSCAKNLGQHNQILAENCAVIIFQKKNCKTLQKLVIRHLQAALH